MGQAYAIAMCRACMSEFCCCMAIALHCIALGGSSAGSYPMSGWVAWLGRFNVYAMTPFEMAVDGQNLMQETYEPRCSQSCLLVRRWIVSSVVCPRGSGLHTFSMTSLCMARMMAMMMSLSSSSSCTFVSTAAYPHVHEYHFLHVYLHLL